MVSVCDSTRRGGSNDQLRLQAKLEERAGRLHKYISSKIPAGVRRVIAPEDILQEVWLAAFKGIAGFTADGPDAFDRWLVVIAHRELGDAIRNARRLRRGGGHQTLANAQRCTSSYIDLFARATADQRTPSSEDAAREAAHAVQIALCSLPDDYQNAVRLRYLEDQSPEEIAATMGRTHPAVRGLLYRGLRMLRARLEPVGRFFSDGG